MLRALLVRDIPVGYGRNKGNKKSGNKGQNQQVFHIFHLFESIFSTSSPTVRDRIPVSHTGRITEKGAALPESRRRDAMLVGISVRAAEFITTKRTVSLSAKLFPD